MIARSSEAASAPNRHDPSSRRAFGAGAARSVPRPLPRAPTLEGGAILSLMMAFWGPCTPSRPSDGLAIWDRGSLGGGKGDGVESERRCYPVRFNLWRMVHDVCFFEYEEKSRLDLACA
jgi:hypothetical protein